MQQFELFPSTMRGIAEEVAREHGMTLEQLKARTHDHRISHPRQVAMARIYDTGKYSLTQIGMFFDRDHTTVLHATHAVAARLTA